MVLLTTTPRDKYGTGWWAVWGLSAVFGFWLQLVAIFVMGNFGPMWGGVIVVGCVIATVSCCVKKGPAYYGGNFQLARLFYGAIGRAIGRVYNARGSTQLRALCHVDNANVQQEDG